MRAENKQVKEISKKKKISKPRRNKTPLHDMFTTLCKSDLHVDCVKEFRFHPVRRWRFDYAIPDHKIAIEVEGGVWTCGRHTRPKGFLGDMEKYNTATLLGWRVFRTTPKELLSKETLNLIKDCIKNN